LSGVVYENKDYGFEINLPESWREYSVVVNRWEGLGLPGDAVVTDGPMISLRHRAWTEEEQRQDIPIMILTTKQWDDLNQEKFHIGAAPIGPSELGRNANFVFALPARYNYAFLPGYEEVEQIIQRKSFRVY
jgi:hypothetical protein